MAKMSKETTASDEIIWVSDIDLSTTLHAATWLDTTAALRNLGWKVTLIAPSDAGGNQQIRGVDVKCFRWWKVFLLKQVLYRLQVFFWLLFHLPRKGVIFFHEYTAVWAFGFRLLTRLFTRRPIYYVMDTRSLPMEPEDGMTLRTKLRHNYFWFVYRHASRWLDGFTMITPAMVEAVGVDPQKVWLIWPSGVTLEKFSPAAALRKFPGENEPIELLYIGCMHLERNLMPFCQAVVDANMEQMKFHFVMVGEGNQFDELQEYAQAHSQSIEVLPAVPQHELIAFMAKAQVGVLPFPDELKFRVSSFIKLFEYMGAGLVLAATRMSAHEYVVGDGQFVIWSEGAAVDQFSDCLMKVWRQKQQLPAMSANALEASHLWTWEAAARKISDGFQTKMNEYSHKKEEKRN